MFNVLIVDDEPIIREGLRTIIDWESYGFSICGEGTNGRDGLQKAKELKPDLIIVDIKMPGMDGLQMIEELKEAKLECKFIILSGYSEFAYAQRAIREGVMGYLLKPIETNELINYVIKIKEEFVAKIKLYEKLKVSTAHSRKKVLEKLVKGYLKPVEFNEISLQLNMDFPWNSYQVIIIALDKDEKFDNDAEEAIENFAHNKLKSYIFNLDNHIGLLFRDFDVRQDKLFIKSLKRNLCSITGKEIFIAVGKAVTELFEIFDSYIDAFDIISKRFIYYDREHEAEAICDVSVEELSVEEQDKRILESLFIAIDTNGTEAIKKELNKKIELMIKYGYSEKYIKANYINMYVAVENRIINNNKGKMDYLSDNHEFLVELYEKNNIKNLNDLISIRFLEISMELAKQRPEGPIKKIIDYIYRNYQLELKLETIAQSFNYNSAYCGKLFKIHTGEHFNTFVDKVRIEKAKELLYKDYKIYQISSMVGFKDKDYFASKFKKYVGVTPTTYKQEISSNWIENKGDSKTNS